MTAIILAIGSELLNGEVIDTNSPYLQKELSYYDIQTLRVILVRDIIDHIANEIHKNISECDYLFITGGLGPTEDDLTREAVAKAVGQNLIQNPDEWKILLEKFNKYKYKISPNNEKQTFFPEKSSILNNSLGTASGFYISKNKCKIFVLPGVPSELKNIFQNEIKPILNNYSIYSPNKNKLTVKVMGVGESNLDQMINKNIIPKHPIRWEIIARADGVFLKFYSINKSLSNQWKDPLKQDLINLLGENIYGYDEMELGDIIATLLKMNKLKLGTVESCTGGYVSKYLTDVSGSSSYFTGGIITYSNDLKIKLAGVDPKLIDKYGAVSSEVAEAMARGGKIRLGCDICMAITGIAGPLGATPDKPVGTVHFALINQDNKLWTRKRQFIGDRKDIRRKSLFYSLNMVRLGILNKLQDLE